MKNDNTFTGMRSGLVVGIDLGTGSVLTREMERVVDRVQCFIPDSTPGQVEVAGEVAAVGSGGCKELLTTLDLRALRIDLDPLVDDTRPCRA